MALNPDESPLRADAQVLEKCDDSPVESPMTDEVIQSLTPPAKHTDNKQLLKPVDRGAPGDAALMAMVKRGPEEVQESKRKSHFYGEVFAYRAPQMNPRERISRESVITAEVKSNVIIQDEYTFITDLCSQLSTRYQRPPTSIVIILDHSACLLFGGTFDPAYTLTITALPSQLQPVSNKRNASLIQSFFAEALNVPPHRGVIRFVAVAEDCLATNGTTVLGEIESLNKAAAREKAMENIDTAAANRSRQRSATAAEKAKPRGRSHPRSGENEKTAVPKMPPPPIEKSPLDLKAEKVQRMGKRRSFMQMFGK